MIIITIITTSLVPFFIQSPACGLFVQRSTSHPPSPWSCNRYDDHQRDNIYDGVESCNDYDDFKRDFDVVDSCNGYDNHEKGSDIVDLI